jgi:hypothetical protein
MQAVVFKEPFKVAVEQRPIPTVQHPEDIVVKVKYTALCGRYVRRIMHPIYIPWWNPCVNAVLKLVICTSIVALSRAPRVLSWAMSLWVKLSNLAAM